MTSQRKRRSKFEVCFEIIELCQYPGIPISRLVRDARMNIDPLRKILSTMLTGELLRIETKPLSISGDRRKTDYYIRTPEGDELHKQFRELVKRISMSESQSKLK